MRPRAIASSWPLMVWSDPWAAAAIRIHLDRRCNQHRMGAPRHLADLLEMQVHGLDVGIGVGTHRAENIGPTVTLVARGSGTAATLTPNIGQAALLTDPCLVLPP
jgi:hypothetical protein